MVAEAGFKRSIDPDRAENVRYVYPSPLPREWTRKEIDDELRENGIKQDFAKGFYLLKYIGFGMEMSHKIARGQFVIKENICQPNGELISGVIEYITESIASIAGQNVCESRQILGVELNVNHLRPAFVGQELTAIARPLKHGSSIQVWEVKIETQNVKESTTESNAGHNETVLIAIGRFTLVVQTPSAVKKAVRAKL